MYRKSLQCKTGYRNMASLMCSERGLDKNATEFKCCKFIQKKIIVFQITFSFYLINSLKFLGLLGIKLTCCQHDLIIRIFSVTVFYWYYLQIPDCNFLIILKQNPRIKLLASSKFEYVHIFYTKRNNCCMQYVMSNTYRICIVFEHLSPKRQCSSCLV